MPVCEQARYAEVNTNWTRDVFAGNASLDPGRMFPALLAEKLPGADKVTFEDFKHAASLVTSSLALCYERCRFSAIPQDASVEMHQA